MIIAKLLSVRLRPRSDHELTAHVYGTAQNWINTWTPDNNFKTLVAANKEEAVSKFQKLLSQQLTPSWVGCGPEYFVFTLAISAVDEDGFFWPGGGGSTCENHPIPAKES